MGEVENRFYNACEALRPYSKSQSFQDVWAWFENDCKPNGTYIEFGATDGVAGSNTYMLDYKFNWSGILAEPLPQHSNALHANRNSIDHYNTIINACVWTESDKMLDFKITDEPDLSTIDGYGVDDEHAEKRRDFKIVQVPTISLFDLIEKYSAHRFGLGNPTVDYLSVDTEGSEYHILKAYFENPKSEQHLIKCITVEHNYKVETRQMIYDLLTSKGYKRKYEEVSRWDDFYSRVP